MHKVSGGVSMYLASAFVVGYMYIYRSAEASVHAQVVLSYSLESYLIGMLRG